ncbi:DUF4783 domain-containing protein [Fibrisoma montanum]|uniref:DUF4783 domain-containing protein n=2 Tax=Fibrisoma montanum TaxID=2305895 RepID=A0A418M1T1_9BACT|nr:DUF4783 domain-containing protein [Fibrisoma montanum]
MSGHTEITTIIMKALVALLLFSTLWTTPPANSSPGTQLSETIRISLRNGNAGQLSAHFASTIELIIDSEKVEFSSLAAPHAELILRSFFRKYPPHSFQFVYRGASDRLLYSTGTYATEGHAFTVYVLMRQTAGRQYVINALHFRKEA